MKSQHRPDLSPEQVVALLPYTEAFAEDDLEEASQFYGQPLQSVIGGCPPGWSWLETALVAGYLPEFEAIGLALRATHAAWLNEVDNAEANGVDGDALGSTETDLYRSLITQIESFVVELEERRVSLLRKAQAEEPESPVCELWREDERRAAERASKAQERKASAQADAKSNETMRDKYQERLAR